MKIWGQATLRRFPVADFDRLDPERPLWHSAQLADLAPVVVSRDSGRTFYDICAHRRAAILNGESQNDTHLRCPYHGWRFNAEGHCHKGSLIPVSQQELGGIGLIFAGKNQIEPDTFNDVATVFNQFRWGQMKPLARRRYSVASHWAYWVENFLECYHCSFNHPQLCSVENHIAAASNRNYSDLGTFYNAASAELSAMGAHRPFASDWDPEEAVPTFIDFNTLSKGHVAATQTGVPVGPVINIFDQHLQVFYYGAVGPFFHFSLYSDHLFLTNFRPDGDATTIIECCWMGHVEAIAIEEEIVWLWENTMLQDIELVARLHVGRSLNLGAAPSFIDSEEQSLAFWQWFEALPESHQLQSKAATG